MRILITGITGFVGGHLAEALIARGGAQLFGLSREEASPAPLAHLAGQAQLFKVDLCDEAAALDVLQAVQPDQIYHLAGFADVGQSLREPDQAWRANLTATRALYDAVTRWGGKARILFVGSGSAYGGPRREGEAFTEESPFYPPHPYAASKAAADLLSFQYSCVPGLDVVRARPFNHIGPRQSPQFAVAHFAKQIAAIEHGRQEPVLQTGNLDAARDVTDVRDVVRAYLALMEGGVRGEAYNIAAEKLVTMRQMLDALLALSPVKVEVRQQPGLTRASEPFVTRASCAKIRGQTGWLPSYRIEKSLLDTLNHWRKVFA